MFTIKNSAKICLLWSLSMGLFFSCDGSKDASVEKTTLSTSPQELPTDANVDSLNTLAKPTTISGDIWQYDLMNDTIRQVQKIDSIHFSAETLVQNLNEIYGDKVFLELDKTSQDTLYVSIENSLPLTSQMGSSGAMEYMVQATFTLTELPNIEHVHFDFEEGDHAMPGTYNRKYYWDWLARNQQLNQ